MAISRGLTLFTSDSRPRYATDILNVLALPCGFPYHFRYDTKYISSELKNEFENLSPAGTKLMIAFKDESVTSIDTPFMVPIRWAVLQNIELLPDFYIVNFTLDGYPVYSKEYTVEKAAIADQCRKYLGQIPTGTCNLPVQFGLTPFVELRTTSERAGWIDVAKRLALHENFSVTHFLRIAEILDENGRRLQVTSEGELILHEQQYARIRIDYFALNFGSQLSELMITGDSSLLRVASRPDIPLDSRYDSTKVLIHGSPVPGRTVTGLNISTKDSRLGAPQTHLFIPFLIRRSKGILLWRITLSGIGAGLVATPGILGTTVSSTVQILIACVGALLLAVGTVIGSAVK